MYDILIITIKEQEVQDVGISFALSCFECLSRNWLTNLKGTTMTTTTKNIITVTETAVNERVNGSKMVNSVSLDSKVQLDKAIAMLDSLKSSIHKTDGLTVNMVREFLPLVRAYDLDYIVNKAKEKTTIKASIATVRLAHKTADQLDDYGIVYVPVLATMASLRKLLTGLNKIKANKPQLLTKLTDKINDVFADFDGESYADIKKRAEFETNLFALVNSRLKKLKSTPKAEEVAEKELVKGITAGQINDVPLLVAHIKGILNNTTKGELLRAELQGLLNSMDKHAKKSA